MMFNSVVRFRPLRTLLAQWHRQTVDSTCKRNMCNKPQEGATEAKAATPAPSTSHLGFKVPGYRPSDFDKKMLLWSGRFKTREQIPEIVSFEMLDAARNRMRVKVAYGMMAATVVACIAMVILGKQGAKNHDSLTARNMEKKARWREEAQREREEAAAAGAAAAAVANAALATEKAQ